MRNARIAASITIRSSRAAGSFRSNIRRHASFRCPTGSPQTAPRLYVIAVTSSILLSILLAGCGGKSQATRAHNAAVDYANTRTVAGAETKVGKVECFSGQLPATYGCGAAVDFVAPDGTKKHSDLEITVVCAADSKTCTAGELPG